MSTQQTRNSTLTYRLNITDVLISSVNAFIQNANTNIYVILVNQTSTTKRNVSKQSRRRFKSRSVIEFLYLIRVDNF